MQNEHKLIDAQGNELHIGDYVTLTAKVLQYHVSAPDEFSTGVYYTLWVKGPNGYGASFPALPHEVSKIQVPEPESEHGNHCEGTSVPLLHNVPVQDLQHSQIHNEDGQFLDGNKDI